MTSIHKIFGVRRRRSTSTYSLLKAPFCKYYVNKLPVGEDFADQHPNLRWRYHVRCVQGINRHNQHGEGASMCLPQILNMDECTPRCQNCLTLLGGGTKPSCSSSHCRQVAPGRGGLAWDTPGATQGGPPSPRHTEASKQNRPQPPPASGQCLR